MTLLLDLVLPRQCVGCGRSGVALCAVCRPSGALVRSEVSGTAVVAAAQYDGAVRQALLAFKERGRRDLNRPLAGLLADAVRASVPGRDVVLVPVPSAAAAARARGGDHVRRLTRTAARRCGLAVFPALQLVRAVSDSAVSGPRNGPATCTRRCRRHRAATDVRPSSSTTS